ncbi:hypothetical protein DM02DRAFT_103006 [Periconia macrospinosa]|uniref:N-acetyltransferase domain-containing protein n=1 Tax=Periconia macrospinosa TaxID=97972 RepID=A0A2V1DFG6_9PLEO|nr:hypothetical protein DM02DRAFT_103006 [Periconia macrospinosa]
MAANNTKLISLLLFQPQLVVSPSTLPFLKGIQDLLNTSYTATYCAHPEIFGTSHLRVADPAQIADIIGDDGFTVVVLLVNEEDGYAEIVATGSVKNFGDGDVESYAQWSKNLSGTHWAEKAKENDKSEKDLNHKTSLHEKKDEEIKYEVTAFAVSTEHQSMGLGARVLKEIEWLASADTHGVLRIDRVRENTAHTSEFRLRNSSEDGCIQGINIDQLKSDISSISTTLPTAKKSRLVLMGIRELGNEAYYQRRGWKSVWSGTVPVGMWDCKQECTMVYMEKDLAY